jgi:[protein-PII] uridylyltransferase
MFATETVVSFDHDGANNRTVMELVAPDRPGLLSTVGRAFIELDLDIEAAKILTIGERAEDVFYIVDRDHNALSDALCDALRERLINGIDSTA